MGAGRVEQQAHVHSVAFTLIPTGFTRLRIVPGSLLDRSPQLDRGRLVRDLVPPPRFDAERFSHLPARSGRAVARRRRSSASSGMPPGWASARRRAGSGGGRPAGRTGGASTSTAASGWARPTCWRPCGTRPSGAKAFGTFVEYTNLVGALGFQPTVEALQRPPAGLHRRVRARRPRRHGADGDPARAAGRGRRVPGRHVQHAARTPSGEGRFAAEDFLREIQALSARFEVLTVDGPDYRHRDTVDSPPPSSEDEVRAGVDREGGLLDHFVDVTRHLATGSPQPLPRDARRRQRGGVDPRAAGDGPGRRPAAGRPRRPALRRGHPGLRQRTAPGRACSPRRCWPAATARSTSGRSRDSLPSRATDLR